MFTTRLLGVLARLRDLDQGAKSPVYLPEIILSCEAMLNNLEASQERREQMAAALGRLVTEDYEFSESVLGGEVLQIADDFASFGEDP